MIKNVHQFTTAQRRCGLRTLALMKLRHELGGRATANEIAAALGKALKHVWPRLDELQSAGLIRDTGLRVHGKGRPATIWADCETTHANNDKMVNDPTADAPAWFNDFGQ